MAAVPVDRVVVFVAVLGKLNLTSAALKSRIYRGHSLIPLNFSQARSVDKIDGLERFRFRSILGKAIDEGLNAGRSRPCLASRFVLE
jgi:hypothetical protein